MGSTKRPQPRGCKGFYVPWTCGACELKQACRPSTPTFKVVEKRKKVRA